MDEEGYKMNLPTKVLIVGLFVFMIVWATTPSRDYVTCSKQAANRVAMNYEVFRAADPFTPVYVCPRAPETREFMENMCGKLSDSEFKTTMDIFRNSMLELHFTWNLSDDPSQDQSDDYRCAEIQ